MACGQCIYRWDFNGYKYVHLYSDCDFWCQCDTPPSGYSGEYIYVPCVASATTTTGDPSTSTTSTSSTTLDPSTSSSSSSSSSTTTEQPYIGMDCLPERILEVYVEGTGEFHVPLSDSESCVHLSTNTVACGRNSEVLVGNIYNCPTILDGVRYLSINVGDYVVRDSEFNYPYGIYKTLALPRPYDFVVISGWGSYISSSMDFREVPLRYVYVGPGSVLKSLSFSIYCNDVKEYCNLFTFGMKPEDNVYRLTYNYSRSHRIPPVRFVSRFQYFTQVNPSIVYWMTPYDREIQPIIDLPNPRYYCSPNQKTFGIHYEIQGGRSFLGGELNESVTYACNIGGLFVAGQNHTCDSDTPNMTRKITAVSNGYHFEVGGFVSRIPWWDDRLGIYGGGGFACCPPLDVGGVQFCPDVCPDNSLGPTTNNDWRKEYLDLVRHLPYEFTPPLDAISCIPSDYCREEKYVWPPHYSTGCYDDVNVLLAKPLRVHVFGKYVDIPYVYSFGGCNYFVTFLEEPSKWICNREKPNGDRTALWMETYVAYSSGIGDV